MIIKSLVSTSSRNFKENFSNYQKLIEKLHIAYQTQSGSLVLSTPTQATLSEKNKKELPKSSKNEPTKNTKLKLTVAERLNHLLDPSSDRLYLSSLAAMDMYPGVPPGAGMECLIGKVSGKTVMIIANNYQVKGGTYYPMTIKKHLRAQEIALENHLPCIYLVDSGGAFLPLQAEVFPDKEHFGRIFYNQALLSKKNIPQLAVVLGLCTAGGAYVPAMCEEAIMVKNQSAIFLGGPPLVKAATGIEISAEELGGADVHCKVSGLADYYTESEQEALEKARELVNNYPDSILTNSTTNIFRLSPTPDYDEPLYPVEEIYGIVGDSLKKTFPVKEVIARIVDGSRFSEFKSEYSPEIKCGFSSICGYQVGIIANDGILFGESALKATHFIEMCDKRDVPLLFLQNIVGFMVGKEYEHNGIAKDGAKLVTAVSTTSVPKITLVIGGSFGAGNYAMCGRAFSPRFLFTWPNSRISVMGGEQAATVLTEVKMASNLKNNSQVATSEELNKIKEEITNKYELEGSPFYATARLWDDGIIDPLYTRQILAQALASIRYKKDDQGFGIFRM